MVHGSKHFSQSYFKVTRHLSLFHRVLHIFNHASFTHLDPNQSSPHKRISVFLPTSTFSYIHTPIFYYHKIFQDLLLVLNIIFSIFDAHRKLLTIIWETVLVLLRAVGITGDESMSSMEFIGTDLFRTKGQFIYCTGPGSRPEFDTLSPRPELCGLNLCLQRWTCAWYFNKVC